MSKNLPVRLAVFALMMVGLGCTKSGEHAIQPTVPAASGPPESATSRSPRVTQMGVPDRLETSLGSISAEDDTSDQPGGGRVLFNGKAIGEDPGWDISVRSVYDYEGRILMVLTKAIGGNCDVCEDIGVAVFTDMGPEPTAIVWGVDSSTIAQSPDGSVRFKNASEQGKTNYSHVVGDKIVIDATE